MPIIGRESPLSEEWLSYFDDTPMLILLKPTVQPIATAWFNRLGIQIRDDFLVEPNPSYQLADNPTTLVVSSVNLQSHPAISLQNHQVLLQGLRSVTSNPTNSQHLGIELIHASPQSWAETDYTNDVPNPTVDKDIIGRVPVMVEVSRIQSGAPRPYRMVLGTASLLENNLVERNSFNASFAIQLLDTLRGATIVPDTSESQDVNITMNPQELKTFVWIWIIGLPLGGLGYRMYRRRA